MNRWLPGKASSRSPWTAAVVLLSIWMASRSSPALAQLVLSDTYDTPQSGVNDDLASRQAGLLATVGYEPFIDTFGGMVGISANRLRTTATGNAILLADLSAGATGQAIVDAGGFLIEVEITLPTGGFAAVTFGNPDSSTNSADFGMLLLANNDYSAIDRDGTLFSGAFTPAADPYRLQLLVRTSDLSAGGAATVWAFVNDEPLDLGAAGLGRDFAWASGSNHVLLGGFVSDAAEFDNLRISTVPESQSLFLLAGIAGGLFVWRGRRAAADPQTLKHEG